MTRRGTAGWWPNRQANQAIRLWIVAAVTLVALTFLNAMARAEGQLGDITSQIPAASIFPQADRLGSPEGNPPVAPAYSGDKLLGYVFLNSDFVDATGYSGKPIRILMGIGLDGVITGAKLIEHHEPIVLVGIPEQRIRDFIARFVGTNVLTPSTAAVDAGTKVDAISGATVTVMIIADSMTRASHAVIDSRGIGGHTAAPVAGAGPHRVVDPDRSEVKDWATLLGDGSIRRLHLSVGEVNEAFQKTGNSLAASKAESTDPADTFIDLYIAPVTIPTIGRSLLGEDGYAQLLARLKPGQQAIAIAGAGTYSFKGSGYVRGGIFDRIRLVQGEHTIRFHDHDYARLGELAVSGAPELREIGLFVTPEDAPLEPTQPWRLQLLVQRQTGALDKAFLNFDLGYQLPESYLKAVPVDAAGAVTTPAPATAVAAATAGPPLWERIWRQRMIEIAITLAALGFLTFIFFFQDIIVRRPRLTNAIRVGFLIFTVIWIGGYAQAQLSVVNVVTFSNSLLTGFKWEHFLLEPLIFVLWFSVAASLLFWGRGAYCGWLCPFGALQELANRAAKLVGIPQIKVPWGLHERLWPIKYILFLVILGASMHSITLGEQLAEVEPFKTVVVLRFMRDWPFVIYAVVLLLMGLFVERFFCRYLCPLGAALGIPGRLRMFDWLKRHKECGSPCHRCAVDCMVQAIHPDGHINPNECLYCLHCQTLYYDDHKCPPVIQRRLKLERRLAMQSPSMAGPVLKKPKANVLTSDPVDADE